MHTPLAADREDRHNVGVVQLRRRLGFGLEPVQLVRVQRRGEGQDFQGHPAVERDLLGLVDDPHAAPADRAEEPEIPELGRLCESIAHFVRGIGVGIPVDSAGQPQDRQAGAELIGDRRVVGRQPLRVDGVARLDRRQVGLQRRRQLRVDGLSIL
jgi:hypothetical protein